MRTAQDSIVINPKEVYSHDGCNFRTQKCQWLARSSSAMSKAYQALPTGGRVMPPIVWTGP